MKKVLIAAVLAVFAVVVFAGCNAEELKKLNEQVAQLTKDNQTLSAKVDGLEKVKSDLGNQVAAANAKLDAANKEIADLKAAAEAAAAKPAKKQDKKAAKKAADPAAMKSKIKGQSKATIKK